MKRFTVVSLTISLLLFGTSAFGAKAGVFSVPEITTAGKGAFYSLEKALPTGGKDKSLLISFFATYCEPCKKEIPHLAKLKKELGDTGFDIVLISIDKDEAKAKEAAQLVAENGTDLKVLWDRFNIVARRYSVEALPHMVWIQGDRTIGESLVGYDLEKLAGLKKIIGRYHGVSR